MPGRRNSQCRRNSSSLPVTPQEDPQVQAARILAEDQICVAQIQAQAQADAMRRIEELERKRLRQQVWKAPMDYVRSLSAPAP